MSLIEKLVNEILNLEDTSIYSVNLIKNDHSTHWTAYAHLRADTHGRSFSAEAPTPEMALGELKKVINSLTCEYCHQVLPDDKL